MMVQKDMGRVPKCSACEAQFVLAWNEIVFVTLGQKGRRNKCGGQTDEDALFQLEVL